MVIVAKQNTIKALENDKQQIEREKEEVVEKTKQLRVKLRAASERHLRRFVKKMLLQEAKVPILNWREAINAMRNQQVAERKMRRVAGKIMQQDTIFAVDEWKTKVAAQKAEEAKREEGIRIERFKKRVMGRMTKQACVEARGSLTLNRPTLHVTALSTPTLPKPHSAQ